MPTQLCLDGISAPPAPTDRLFFALLPDPEATRGILRCARELQCTYGLRSRLLEPHRLHLSLQHLGNHAGLAEAWTDAARRVAASIEFPAFDLSLDRVLTFNGHARVPRPLPCVMTTAASHSLHGLHRTLAVAMRDRGLPVQSWSITPHVTMFYDPAVIDERTVTPIHFRVREFVIVHTRIGTGRPYELLGRWPLRQPNPGRCV